jgi:hypothetical protein
MVAKLLDIYRSWCVQHALLRRVCPFEFRPMWINSLNINDTLNTLKALAFQTQIDEIHDDHILEWANRRIQAGGRSSTIKDPP